MKVLVPVKNLLYGIELIKKGAGEIYFGVVGEDWTQKYDFKNPINARSMYDSINYSEARKLLDYCHENGVEGFITLNRVSPQVDYDLLVKEIENIISLKPDALIVRDMFIAEIIRSISKDIPIHCSSLNQVINKEGIEFWVENYNISRVILPRNIAINEIFYLSNQFPNLEFEVFVKNSWCYNSDGICGSLHEEGVKRGIKYLCYREDGYESENEEFMEKYTEVNKNRGLTCKACVIGKIKDIKNLVSLKIVGREKSLPRITNDLLFVKNVVERSKNFDDYKKFTKENMKDYKSLYKIDCFHTACEFVNY